LTASHDVSEHATAEHQFATEGYAVIPDAISDLVLAEVIAKLASLSEGRAGSRRLLDARWCADLGTSINTDRRFQAFLPVAARAVQCTLFEKSSSKNWLVTPHQDLSIPVARRVPSSACRGWSEKEGEVFVQPPLEVLSQLTAVRLHLDDCDEDNGALRVLPGSHLLGRLSSREVLETRGRVRECAVSVSRRAALVLKPLLVHASSKSTSDRPRRVLHFVFGPAKLPDGLDWPNRKSGLTFGVVC